MMKVYLAAPYSKGDVAVNVRAAIHAADVVHGCGCAPFVPHLTHLWHLISPKEYGVWLALDFAWLACCDALVRLPGESAGADREVGYARVLGIPVYEPLEAFVRHMREDARSPTSGTG